MLTAQPQTCRKSMAWVTLLHHESSMNLPPNRSRARKSTHSHGLGQFTRNRVRPAISQTYRNNFASHDTLIFTSFAPYNSPNVTATTHFGGRPILLLAFRRMFALV